MLMSDFEKLTSFQNLYNSMKAASRNGKGNRSAKDFLSHPLENLYRMKLELTARTYKIDPYSVFEVSDPKRRVIMSGSFRDKVLQHCLCDYVLMPKLKDVFILDNYAGQFGKGTLFGLNRLSEHLLAHYAEHGAEWYILKCDISKFYYSIRHDVMKRIVADYFEEDGIRWVCNLLIDSTDGLGLPLGNQSSQAFALMYLDSLDKLVTQEIGISAYGRYSDDFFLISKDKGILKDALVRIKEHLEPKGLSLNGKTEIVPIHRGIRFLGFHVYLTEDGRVIRRVYGEKKRAEMKKLRRCAKAVKQGKMERKKFDEIYGSILNHLSHGNCYKLSQRYAAMVETILNE